MTLNSIIFLVIVLVQGKSEKSICEQKNNCAECIQLKDCAWCSKVNRKIYEQTSQLSKCYPSDKILEICEGRYIDNQKSILKIISNQPMKNGLNSNIVQIRPQEVFLKLRPGDNFTLDVDFQKAENYPVDLYYLMDFSSSMSKHKNNLSKLGNKLSETMKNLTTDFQLGFGSFVDKVTLPFTSTLPSHLVQPCPRCRSPYSFKNHMSLTKLVEKFSNEVGKAQMSGNIDTPEGVLDALMQVIVCRGPLNWREKARHIIVVSTDAPFHLAGDGKLGGVVEPHDGSCYLNEEGDYTHSLDFDYPSVTQINHKALDNNMNIIFAIVNKVKNEYSSLSNEIRGSSWGLLDSKENIADLIKAQYEKITTTIRLTDNARGPVRITYSALCSKGEKWKNSNECTNVKGGSLSFFKVHISVSECSKNKFNNQKIIIKPVGMNETLTINLETICDCECAKESYQGNIKAAEYCSFAGDIICGLCVCYENRIGKNCECKGDNESILNVTDTKGCLSNNLTNEICSGHGECRCGVCQCYSRQNSEEERTGKFCECDNFSCEKSNGLLCSGHGTCKCGTCFCDPQWTGRACDCLINDNKCRVSSEEELCSKNGECVCGVCHCRNKTGTEEHRYAGKFCQICMTCLPQCHIYNDCVECLSYDSGPHAGVQCRNCHNIFHHVLADSLEEVQKNYSGNLCVSADHLGCTFKYFYYYHENDQLILWSEKHTSCPKRVNYAVIAGTIGSTVLVGLLSLIIWKVIVEIHDKQEYEKFERERNLAKWGRGENPLFKKATTTYANPTYTTDYD